MKTYEVTIAVPKSTANKIQAYLFDDFSQHPDHTIIFTAKFPNKFEMDIKCCGSFEEESSWTEAVLFDEKGRQITYTDVEEEFFGEWELKDNEIIYKVNVISE